MTNPIHVLAISGSLRRASYNTGLLRAAVELAPDGMSIEIFDLAPLPFYNGDVEAAGLPDAVRGFRAKLVAADALLIATPEYNYSITGVLKNAIDWASRPPKDAPLTRKPVAIFGAGGMMGTVRAQLHLRQILLHSDVRVLNKPEVYVSRAWEKFDPAGNLTDTPTRQEIGLFLAALQAHVVSQKSTARPVAVLG